MRTVKKTAIVGGTVAALIGGGVAFAAWTSTGSGNGQVSSISDAGLRVTSIGTDGLFPTSSKTISVTVENLNPYKVALDSITVDRITASNPDCNVGAVTSPNNTSPATTLAAAGATAASATFPFVVSMSNDANPSCQTNTFTVDFTANGHSTN